MGQRVNSPFEKKSKESYKEIYGLTRDISFLIRRSFNKQLLYSKNTTLKKNISIIPFSHVPIPSNIQTVRIVESIIEAWLHPR